MKLRDLLLDLEYDGEFLDLDTDIKSIVFDSREITKDCLFICIEGVNIDRHQYAPDAAAGGAAAIVISHPIAPLPCEVGIIRVKDCRYAMAHISAAFYGHPAKRLKVIGVTGTKGKTTTTYMIKSILENAGRRVGLVGTIEVIIGQEHIHAGNTTPESTVLQAYFARMLEAGLDTVVMEVSSQALKMHRTQGFIFEVGVFTNLGEDHIAPGEHENFEEYLQCKALLFKQCRVGIVNFDDTHTKEILAGNTCDKIITFGQNEGADLMAKNTRLIMEEGKPGVAFHVCGKKSDQLAPSYEARVSMPGQFTVYNSLAAIAVCRHFAVREDDIKRALSVVKVKGRIEVLPHFRDFTVLIDYAHNALALESLLTSLREYQPGRLVCLFGCGGDRAKERRFQMGEVSGRLADFSILTSDNPRTEDPEAILQDIQTGIEPTGGQYTLICDRKEAIAYAITNALDGDMIILAGKGHEDYQEIHGVKYPMDDRVIVAALS